LPPIVSRYNRANTYPNRPHAYLHSRMKQFSSRLNLGAIATVAVIAWATPSTANPIGFSTPPDRSESIEIYVPTPETPSNHVCTELVGSNIDRVIDRFPNQWGILVESIDRQKILYSHNADRFFIPASNTKLITTAAALLALNPDAAIRSKSLRDWVNITNQRSNNAYADTLLKFIGGSRTARSLLATIGIDPSSYRLADGSGLSRNNVATPRALVEILRAMYYSPNRDAFYASLPVAGLSGTLKNRMRNTAATGTVYAKTGTLWGVRALSGYIDHPQEGILVFSIIANNRSVSGQSLVRSIDAIVLQLTGSPSCGN
jgi:serine-type D-Ala-D-Ala carboxypeptidase/endopeptidase (penicillin-binding protein 4)